MPSMNLQKKKYEQRNERRIVVPDVEGKNIMVSGAHEAKYHHPSLCHLEKEERSLCLVMEEKK